MDFLANYFGSLNPMSFLSALPGNIAQGIIWGLMGLGVFLTFKLLNFADLSVDGSFATGGAVTAVMLINGCPVWATIIVAILAGLAAGLSYSLISKASSLAGVIVAGVVCPIVNTGIFLAGCYIFFQEWLVAVFGTTGFVTVVAGLVGVNFLVELGINMVLSTAIVKIIDLGKKQLNSKTKA